MDMMISGLSAFRYYRTPEHPMVKYVFGLPLNTLAEDANLRSCSHNVATMVWTGALPPGAETGSFWCERICSPLFTLLRLCARSHRED